MKHSSIIKQLALTGTCALILTAAIVLPSHGETAIPTLSPSPSVTTTTAPTETKPPTPTSPPTTMEQPRSTTTATADSEPGAPKPKPLSTQTLALAGVSSAPVNIYPPSALPTDGAIVTLPAELTRCVNKSRNQPENTPITIYDLSLDYLSCDGLTSLTGLEKFRALDKVRLSGSFTDLSPLRGLPQMERVELNAPNLVNIAPISRVAISELSLQGDRIDISQLRDFTRVKTLTLTMPARDIDASHLLNMSTLYGLYLDVRSAANLSSLSKLPLTRIVSIRANVSDAHELSWIRASAVVLDGNSIADARPLTTAKKHATSNTNVDDPGLLGMFMGFIENPSNIRPDSSFGQNVQWNVTVGQQLPGVYAYTDTAIAPYAPPAEYVNGAFIKPGKYTLNYVAPGERTHYDLKAIVNVSEGPTLPYIDIQVISPRYKDGLIAVNIADTVTLVASRLLPNTDTTFVLHSDPVILGTVKSDAQGIARLQTTMPRVPEGIHSVTAVQGDKETAVTKIYVLGAADQTPPHESKTPNNPSTSSAGHGKGLPNTGATATTTATTPISVGLIALLLGAGVTLLTLRVRTSKK